MKKVYLDNNILIDIESNRYSLHDFLSVPNVCYYYSDAHISELLEAKGNPKVSQDERFNLISSLCGQRYIVTGVLDKPEIMDKDVRDTYKIAELYSFMRIQIDSMALNGVNIFERIRGDLGFDSKAFNNIEPEKVLSVLDERMKEKLNIGLIPYLIRSEALGGKPLYYTLLNIIDAANYWGDVRTDRSEIAKLNDASHAYSAQICDCLVTNDKRMRVKVKAIYDFLGVKTQLLSAQDFLKMQFA